MEKKILKRIQKKVKDDWVLALCRVGSFSKYSKQKAKHDKRNEIQVDKPHICAPTGAIEGSNPDISITMISFLFDMIENVYAFFYK